MSKTIKWFLGLSYLLMIGVNILANSLPINGVTSGQVSDAYPNLFAPSGFTFSIWAVIYGLLGLAVVVLVRYPERISSSIKTNLLRNLTLWFGVSSMTNALWLVAWHYQMMWMTVILMVILLSMVGIVLLKVNDQQLTDHERKWLKPAFSIYFGWLTIATVANVVTYLVSVNFDGVGIEPATWMAIILIVSTVIGVITMFKMNSGLYGCVFVWAYIGIWTKHTSQTGWNNAYPLVVSLLYGLIVIMVGAVIWQVVLERKRSHHNT